MLQAIYVGFASGFVYMVLFVFLHMDTHSFQHRLLKNKEMMPLHWFDFVLLSELGATYVWTYFWTVFCSIDLFFMSIPYCLDDHSFVIKIIASNINSLSLFYLKIVRGYILGAREVFQLNLY